MDKVVLEFYKDDDLDPFVSCEWPCVPRTGDHVTIKGISGVVKRVCWGVCGFPKNPLFDKPCAAIEITTKERYFRVGPR